MGTWPKCSLPKETVLSSIDCSLMSVFRVQVYGKDLSQARSTNLVCSLRSSVELDTKVSEMHSLVICRKIHSIARFCTELERIKTEVS
jgi:hypothetical protein